MTDLQPSWVLGRKNYGDNGMLVEFFSAVDGRCGAIAKGAFRRKPGGNLAALLQPFHPLLIKLSGRGELRTLVSAEAPTLGYTLRAESLMSGLYLNELLTRVLPRFDPHPSLFVFYGETVEALQTGPPDLALRRFELVLLKELGYRVDWAVDDLGDPILEAALYRYEAGRGFVAISAAEPLDERQGIRGKSLLYIAQVLQQEQAPDSVSLSIMKAVTRSAVSVLTAGRPIHSRSILRSLRKPSTIS